MTQMEDAYGYVRKTLRAAAILAICSVVVAANFGLTWAIVPLLSGLALGVVLLVGWWVISGAIVAGARRSGSLEEKSREKRRVRVLILLFALVKYPMVAALIWWLTRVWAARELSAFLLGFLLLHLVIASRAVGKLINERPTTE